MEIQQFRPPVRTLMGPGPSDVHPNILEALGRPTIGHLDPEFIRMMDELKSMIQYAFETKNELSMPISAPGSAGMETCFANLLEPGDKALVCVNGVFGLRMIENVERCGATALRTEDDWGKPVDPEKVEATLKANNDIKVLAFVHAETSTGVRSDAESLCMLAKQHGCLVIMDTVTSLGGIPVKVDDWGADAVYSGTQKCLSCTPGLSPVTFSEAATETIRNRKQRVQSWFLDLNLVMGYWGHSKYMGEATKRSYHHTAPVNALYALHEALLLLKNEGLENAHQRHANMHAKLRDGLNAMGIEFLVEPDYRLPMLNTVLIPDGVDDAAVRSRLLNEYNLEIGAGLGALAGKVWRIGLMGHSAREDNVELCLKALKEVI